MKSTNPTGLQNSGMITQLKQVREHLQIESPAEGNPTYQACSEPLPNTYPVTLYFFRPAGRSGYTFDQCRCTDLNDDLTGLFTLGIGEFVVEGRIGQCRDWASHQIWPLLLDPSIRFISRADTKSGRRINDHSDGHSHTDHPARNRTSTETIQEQANSTALYDSSNPITVQHIGGRQ